MRTETYLLIFYSFVACTLNDFINFILCEFLFGLRRINKKFGRPFDNKDFTNKIRLK